VLVKHSSLVNAYYGWEQAYQLRSALLCETLRERSSASLSLTCHLQMANFCFDVFAGDFIRALCSGAKLVICPREFLLEPEKLYALMRQQKIDCAEFVPVVLNNLIQYLEKSKLSLDFIQLLICGSDSWYGSEYKKIKSFIGQQTRLINSFGLTETTIDNSYYETSSQELSTEQLVPIGRPFINTQLYILDSYLQPVPIGVSGELYIGGASLARGYHNRPELTAEKFIHNKFSNQPDARLYKTGDLARYLPDGNIAFIGRADNQVKIRGFRIELGEIEAVLSQHSAVSKAVVIAREDEPRNKNLVAYVVQKPSISVLEITQFRNFVKQKLPQYMIPSAFVLLAQLPLLPNGKIDRKLLPKPDTNITSFQDSFVPPRNAIEEVLAGIWANILRVQQVGIHDNFFDLGGHSLLATQVISRIRETFKLDLPLRCLFESPTVAELSQKLIAYEAKPGMTAKIAQIVKQLEGMSTEEAKQTLENRKVIK
jgi:surfactin family lipopeptide synthetase C